MGFFSGKPRCLGWKLDSVSKCCIDHSHGCDCGSTIFPIPKRSWKLVTGCIKTMQYRKQKINNCLAIERIIHLRRQNTTRASTRVFPVEISSHIFSCVLYDTEHISFCQRAFVRLGYVRSKWRDTILSIPHFWSKFQLDVEGRSCKMLDLPLLLLYVKKLGNSPFCLVVSFGRRNSHPSDRVKRSFKRLERHVHTLTVLYMPWRIVLSILVVLHWEYDRLGCNCFAPFQFKTIYPLPKSWDQRFSWDYRVTTGAYLVKNPRLANWFCIYLLMRCPNLVEFYALHAKWELHKRDSPLFKHIQNLEDLSLAYETVGECNSLCHHLQFPPLRTFSWHSSSREGYHWEFPSGRMKWAPCASSPPVFLPPFLK